MNSLLEFALSMLWRWRWGLEALQRRLLPHCLGIRCSQGYYHDEIEIWHTRSSKRFLYEISFNGKGATITLNRPQQLNDIDSALPYDFRVAVKLANEDGRIHCIVIKSSGPGFCRGCGLVRTAETT